MSRIVEITNNLNNKSGDTEERLDFNDMYNSFKINLQLNSAYEISFTATYTQQYKDAYNMLKMGQGIWYDGREYYITQLENGFDENGLATKQVTAHAILIDLMKNVRIDPKQPTEDSPEVSGDSSSDSSDSDDSQQTGTVVKKTDEQETHSLQELLDKFFKDNDQGISYELHGNFPKQAIDCSGSLYEWLGNNLTSFGAYYIPHNYVLKIYDLESLKLPTDVQLRYLHNVTSVDIQSDGNDFYNDFDVYGGKMEKDITTAGSGNGVNEPVNGDWTPVIQNAASLVGEHLSQADINLVLAQINLESNGKEDAVNNWDSNAAAGHPSKGLLQFIDSTFNYYCRSPYTNIMHGLDQIIALFNIPNWRNQITGHSGWSPHGTPISKAPIQAQQTSSTAGANNIVSFCRSFVGKVPYVWGGSSTSGWDCSGFVCYVLNHFGINTPRTNTIGLESKGTIVGPPYQTGDLLFWGSRGASYHVSIAMDSTYRVGADNERDGTVYRTIASWPPSFAVRVPGFSSGNATNGSDGDSTTTTTTETYYALHYHYHDEESIKMFGLHRGPQVLADSVYDMDTLKQYVKNTVTTAPPTTIENNEIGVGDLHLGNTCKVIAPEANISQEMTLMGISYNPFQTDGDVTLTWNNTGLALKNAIYALYHDIHQINSSLDRNNTYGLIGAKLEDHFKNVESQKQTEASKGQANRPLELSSSQVKAIDNFVNS